MTEQEIEMVIKKKLNQAWSQTVLERVFKKVCLKIVDIMRQRTNEKLDIHGRTFGGYNKSYNKSYALAHAKNKTTFAGSTNTPLRLSGQLFSAMAAQLVGKPSQSGSYIKAKIKVFIDDINQQKKVIGLQSTTGVTRGKRKLYSKKDWQFLGLSVSGSNVSRERIEIQDLLNKELKAELKLQVKI